MKKSYKQKRLYCLLAMVLLITVAIPSTFSASIAKYVKEFHFQTNAVTENTFSVTYYVVIADEYQEFQRFTIVDGQTFTHTYTGTDANAIVNQNGQTLQSCLPEGSVFHYWTNAAGVEIEGQPTYSADMILFAYYTPPSIDENTHQITIYDARNNVLDIVTYTNGEAKDVILARFPTPPVVEDANFKYWGVQVQDGVDSEGVPIYKYQSWADYNLPNPGINLVVRPQYDYAGDLQFVPVDSDGDGTINFYRVDPIRDLPANVVIPGTFMGLPVKELNKLFASTGNQDKAPNIVTVTLGEGVEILREGSLAATPKLVTINLPSTITTIESQVLSINAGQEKNKEITINYNGTRADWERITIANDWAKGVEGVTIICTDQTCTCGKNGSNPKWTTNK